MKSAAAVLLSLPLLASAQPLPLVTTDSADLGIEVSGYRYEETRNGAFFMSTEGNKVGLNGSFTQALGDDWYWGADARVAHGNVVYNSASSGSKGGNPDVVTEARLTGGRDLLLGAQQVLSAHFGLGYRHLFNDLRGYSTTGAVGYRRISEYIYLPLGLTHRLRLNALARFATRIEYDYLLDGRQQSFLSDVDATSNDPVNAQRSGYGLRLHAAYETRNWSLGVFVHYWQIADSDPSLHTLGGVPSGLVMEPSNTTRESGVELKVYFN